MNESFDWDLLLVKIQERKCTPFLGAGAAYPALPLGSEIAEAWAKEHAFPFENKRNLVEVAQFLALSRDNPLFPKEEILKKIRAAKPPNFGESDEPHAVLAALPMPVYITTNYDDFMCQALKAPPRNKEPKRELCKWNETIGDEPSVFDRPFTPTVAQPVVYHLHGHSIPESLVLTEDDYLDFLTKIVREPRPLPDVIQAALVKSTCLFIGYRLADWNFRLLFQGLRKRFDYPSVAVLRPPTEPESAFRIKSYWERYYRDMKVRIYWGTAREFAAELRKRIPEYFPQ